jgi:dynein heavy chain
MVLNFSAEEHDIHPDFRLFLTSMPADYFPVSVLQNGVKLTTEPPRGLRANLKRTYQNFTNPDVFLNDSKKPEAWKKLIFGLSFFHAILQERRKFGPLGWNIRYDFNDSDLETSLTMLRIFLDEQDEIPWDAMLYITGQINYGGRVTDDWDRRCLITLLKKYSNQDILDDGYKFSESGIYYAPTNGSIDIYMNYIDELPMVENPEVFGLHENANITFQNQES